MKKIFMTVIILALLLGSTAAVSAANEPKSITVALTETPASVKVGETINLKAVSEKRGSSFSDCWSNAAGGNTFYDEESGSYVSEAVFKADKPGTYKISYEITMSAGKSDTEFIGRVERNIEVTGTFTLTGADIRDLVVTPVIRSDGSISAYKASGNVYTLWSDGSAILYGSVFFYFGAGETSKNVTETIYDKGVKYTYVVTVKRQ